MAAPNVHRRRIQFYDDFFPERFRAANVSRVDASVITHRFTPRVARKRSWSSLNPDGSGGSSASDYWPARRTLITRTPPALQHRLLSLKTLQKLATAISALCMMSRRRGLAEPRFSPPLSRAATPPIRRESASVNSSRKAGGHELPPRRRSDLRRTAFCYVDAALRRELLAALPLARNFMLRGNSRSDDRHAFDLTGETRDHELTVGRWPVFTAAAFVDGNSAVQRECFTPAICWGPRSGGRRSRQGEAGQKGTGNRKNG
jgi:hypothetical protein